jgi:hypothetical protein
MIVMSNFRGVFTHHHAPFHRSLHSGLKKQLEMTWCTEIDFDNRGNECYKLIRSNKVVHKSKILREKAGKATSLS